MSRSLERTAALALATALTASSCVNEDVTLYRVTVAGEITIDPAYASAGTVHLGLYFARSGQGELAFTVDHIETRALGQYASSRVLSKFDP